MSSTQDYASLPYKAISARLEGPIAIVTLSRPQARNAFNQDMRDDLVDVYAKLDADDRVKVIVLTGGENQGNAFCAGADLTLGCVPLAVEMSCALNGLQQLICLEGTAIEISAPLGRRQEGPTAPFRITKVKYFA